MSRDVLFTFGSSRRAVMERAGVLILARHGHAVVAPEGRTLESDIDREWIVKHAPPRVVAVAEPSPALQATEPAT
jgi:hypothetical protein